MEKRFLFKEHPDAVPKVLIIRKPLMTVAQKLEWKRKIHHLSKIYNLPEIAEELDIHKVFSILKREGIINKETLQAIKS